MGTVFNAVFPIFALILAGFLSAKTGVLNESATESLNKFVVWLALPALLFQAMAGITWPALDHPGFVAAFGGGIAATFAVSFLLGGNRGAAHRLADRSIEGLDAAYANTGFMGIPLCLAAFGTASLVPAIIATILTACVLFAGAIVLIETDLGETAHLAATIRKVSRSLARNPLLISPILGLAVALLRATLNLGLPTPVLTFTTLLGAAASPCALVTIGLFLAQSQAARETSIIIRLVALKLLLQPAITFILAKLYNREAAITSRAILVSTVASLLTVSALTAVLAK